MSVTHRPWVGHFRIVTTSIGLAATLVACGGSDNTVPASTVASNFKVVKAACGTGDTPEKGLQGQIPMAERVAGFKGYNCNLQPLSNSPSANGEGLFEQFAVVRDRSGRVCGYSGPAFLDSKGTKVVDLTDPARIVETALLTTPGMRNPGEGLKVHEGRGLLVSAYYNNAPGTAEETSGFDVYDIGTDCRHPQLLATTTKIKISTASLKPNSQNVTNDRLYGHEGMFSPDGLTYYVGDVPHNAYHAIDIADPTNPKLLTTFQYPGVPAAGELPASVQRGGAHGISVSNDGNRAYPVLLGGDGSSAGGMIPQTGPYVDGFMVVDTSEIQARRPNPKMKMISQVISRENSWAQSTIPVTIAGNKYMLFFGERGAGQGTAAGRRAACAAGISPYAFPQIYSMADENNPTLINKVHMEVNDPEKCSAVPENDTNTGLTYDVHMCSVDNRDNATTMACSYFESGIRVFDIRDPRNIREIAYYNPAAKTSGANAVKWCGAMPILDANSGMLYSRCADSGTVALKFRNTVWPFPDSQTPKDKQL